MFSCIVCGEITILCRDIQMVKYLLVNKKFLNHGKENPKTENFTILVKYLRNPDSSSLDGPDK